MIARALIMAIALHTAGAAASEVVEDVVPSVQQEPAVMLGSCISNGAPVDLERVLFLRNRAMRVDTKRGYNLARVGSETVHIDAYASGEEKPIRTLVHRIDSRAEPDADIDIQVTLAMLGADLLIHWKETFIHKSYRQGLFRVDSDGGIETLCEGRGGIDSSH